MGAMDERSSRMFVGVCLLVLLWIGTYWLYDPGADADEMDISFAGSSEPEPEARTMPPPVTREVVEPAPRPIVEEPPPQPPQGVRVVPPQFREHVVRANESYESIARDELGSPTLWEAIARANPLKDPRRLKVGDVIRVPLDPANIQGVVVGDPVQGGDSSAQTPHAEPVPVEYTIRAGDSLTKIAREYYGSVRFADLIFDANRDRLSSPDALSVGQVLRLPPAPPQE